MYNTNEGPDLSIPLPQDILKKLEQGKTERTLVLPGTEGSPSGKVKPHAKTYVKIDFTGKEDNLIKCVKLLKWSDERLQKLPDLLRKWAWMATLREGSTLYFTTWWWNKEFFEERKHAFLGHSHQSYLTMFGATQDDVIVHHEVVGEDRPFNFWVGNA